MYNPDYGKNKVAGTGNRLIFMVRVSMSFINILKYAGYPSTCITLCVQRQFPELN